MKTICIYHSIDLDGWMSAAIVKLWWEKKYPDGVFYDTPYKGDCSIIAGKENETSLSMYGFNYGDEIPNLSSYDQVIMCDISFPKEEMFKIADRGYTRFIWLDHHISAIKENEDLVNNIVLGIKGLQDNKFAACELTWKYFFLNEHMPEIVRLLGRYDCFGHKGTDEEQKVLEFQYGARSVISNYEEAYNYLVDAIYTSGDINRILNIGTAIYKYLCTEAKQSYKNGFRLSLCEYKVTEGPITGGPNHNFITINKERFNPINFGIDYHKDGYDGAACFHYANGQWNFSLYNDNGLVDCSTIAKQFGGGGHKGAAGFRLSNEDFFKLINK